MRTSEAFPSNYLAASDLRDQEATVSIKDVAIEEVGRDKDRKPVLYFKGKEKGLILNRTNANTIEAVFGDEMDDWIGAEIILYPTMAEFGGKQVAAIRVKMPRRKPVASAPDRSRDNQNPPADRGAMDDEIPF